jgi:DNA polymerase-3 subunit alpha
MRTRCRTSRIPSAELLKFEKELLGFYITSHPSPSTRPRSNATAPRPTRSSHTCAEGIEVTIGGMINRVKNSVTKNGRSAGMKMAMITLEDLEGQMDGVCFAETYEKFAAWIKTEQIVFLRGKIDRRRETPSIVVNDVIPVEESVAKLTTNVGIKLDRVRHTPTIMPELKGILSKHKGTRDVYLQVATDAGRKVSTEAQPRTVHQTISGTGRDLQRLLGSGASSSAARAHGESAPLRQQQLFKETQAESEPEPASDSAEAMVTDAARMDA